MTIESADSLKNLQELIASVETELHDPSAVYPQGAVDGVADMLRKAQRVVDGEYRRPFSHSRHFLPDVDDAAFITRFHTMITGWQTPGDMERTYGLEDAGEWLKSQNLAALSADELAKKSGAVAARAKQVLEETHPGTALGEVNETAYRSLETAAERCESVGTAATVNNSDDSADSAVTTDGQASRESAQCVADCMNAIRDCLASRVLACDLTEGTVNRPTLFFPSDQRQQLIDGVRSDTFLNAQYRKIKDIADEWAFEDAQAMPALSHDNVDYRTANKHFTMWGSSESEFNFVTPANASTAQIEISLPASERTTDGASHAWIDRVRLYSAQEGDWALANPSFDDADPADPAKPAHWLNRSTGTSSISRDARRRFHIFDGASLYLDNPGSDTVDVAKAVSDALVPVPANTACTLTFMAKLDGFMNKGLHLCLCFYDEAGNACGTQEWDFNRAAALWQTYGPGRGPALSAQADAIVWLMEGRKEYAVKAKNEILLELDDFCQGAEHWMVRNCRPYGCDAYGAVQAGRILCSMAAAFTLIQSANVFATDELESFLDMIDYVLLYVTDARDRTALSVDEVLLGATNWQTDMMAGAAVISLALLDAGVLDERRRKQARRTIADSSWFLKAQIDSHVNPDGSFPESLRYHMAALSRYTLIAGLLARGTGDDWYQTTRLRDMFRYYVDMVTPACRYKNGHRSTPTFGDHQLGDGTEFAQLGLHAADVAAIDPALAQQMKDLWGEADRPMPVFGTESVAFEHLMIHVGPIAGHHTDDWKPLTSTAAYPDSGITIFRKAFGTECEQFLAVMASPRPIGHGHFDEGSFIYYKDNVLVAADPGIIGYFDTSKDWLYSSSAHSTMQFASRYGKLKQAAVTVEKLDESLYSRQFGYVDTPRQAKVLNVATGGETESITVEVANPEGNGVQTRTITWFAEPELILVQDQVRDFTGTVRFNLPLAVRGTEETTNDGAHNANGTREFLSEGNYGLRVQTLFLNPTDEITTEWGISSAVSPEIDGRNQLQFLRATTAASNGFAVLLNAMRDGEPAATATRLPDGRLRLAKGDWTATI